MNACGNIVRYNRPTLLEDKDTINSVKDRCPFCCGPLVFSKQRGASLSGAQVQEGW